jgi:hypothetical protein
LVNPFRIKFKVASNIGPTEGFSHHSTGYFWAEREKKKEEKKEL